jgi:3-dehydroquinate synthase
MQKKTYSFCSSATDFYFDASFTLLNKLVGKKNGIVITDKHVFTKHKQVFNGWKTIVIPPGEEHKVQHTVDTIIQQLIPLEANRKTILIGVGGGVVTDITGYVAAVYMRGLRVGFVPTTLLAMVDAAIGGKNGIDVGLYKNMVGTIRQPSFLLYDYKFLQSLPQKEWVNGFAEIIKHACIQSTPLFKLLEQQTLSSFQKNKKLLATLIAANVKIKASVVQKDEWEEGPRQHLNFGHTIGHAIENVYQLSHGHAIAIGMVAAAQFSNQLLGFTQSNRVIDLLKKYQLPTAMAYDKKKLLPVLKMDKKKVKKTINYILLEKIGKATVVALPIPIVEKMIKFL